MGQSANKPLPVSGVKNLRELGGYYTKDGKITKTHVFLRSDELHKIDGNGRNFLHNYGLSLDVDLRDEVEIMFARDNIDYRKVKYDRIPLFSKVQVDIVKDELERKKDLIPKTMGELYIDMLENQKESFVKIITALIDNADCSLFHCTNGKDRTGVTAMLVLSMANVPEDTITADYAASFKYREADLEEEQKKYAKFEKMGIIPDGAFESRPEFIETAINYLNTKYGSACGYLKEIGITDAQFDAFINKFITDKE